MEYVHGALLYWERMRSQEEEEEEEERDAATACSLPRQLNWLELNIHLKTLLRNGFKTRV